jgi:hypothetical protein
VPSGVVVTMSYTEVLDNEAYKQACAQARGTYQLDLIHGNAAWSGADLQGRARQWSSRYARSRNSLIGRLKKAGIPHEFERRKHGKLVLVIGEIPAPTIWERLNSPNPASSNTTG